MKERKEEKKKKKKEEAAAAGTPDDCDPDETQLDGPVEVAEQNEVQEVCD